MLQLVKSDRGHANANIREAVWSAGRKWLVAMSIVCAPLGQAQDRSHHGAKTFQIVEASVEGYPSGLQVRQYDRTSGWYKPTLTGSPPYDKERPERSTPSSRSTRMPLEGSRNKAGTQPSSAPAFVGPLHGIPVAGQG